MKKPSKESDKERFIRIAKELGCDENAPVEEFIENLKKILKAKPIRQNAIKKKPKKG